MHFWEKQLFANCYSKKATATAWWLQQIWIKICGQTDRQCMYESSVDKYLNRLNEQWKNIELFISTIDKSARYAVLFKFEDELEQGHAKLTLIKDDFVKYLNRTKTTESQECLSKLTTIFDEKTNTLEEAFQRISH